MSFQDALFQPSTGWTPPAELPRLPAEFSIDTETRDQLLKTRGPGWCFSGDADHRKGYVVGYAIATAEWSHYFPVRHEGGGNLDADMVERWLRDELAQPKKVVHFANAVYDLGWMLSHNIRLADDAEIHDVMYAAALDDEEQPSFKLDSLLHRYLGERKDSKSLKAGAGNTKDDPRALIWRMPARSVGAYAEQDAGGTLRLSQALRQKMVEGDLERVYDVERSLIPMLVQMRARGMRVDLDRAVEAGRLLEAKEQEALARVHAATGVHLRPGAPTGDAAKVLRQLGVEIPQSGEGRDSVTKGWLEALDHPVARDINAARKFRKAKGDFIDSSILQKHHNGRIHPTFHPLRDAEHGTISGRFSASDPNVQQVPARDPEIGPLIRSIYVPEEGEAWCMCDYSSQEPRWTLHFAARIKARGAEAACLEFRRNPKMSYHDMTARLTGLHKKQAKGIFLGLAYGMGQAKLCRELGLPTEPWTSPSGAVVEVAGAEGKRILDQFHREVPFLKELTTAAKAKATAVGYVRTYLGRRCKTSGNEHKALNRIVQGSAADQGKLAARAVWRELNHIPICLVHDEANYSIPRDGGHETRIAEVMQDCCPGLLVPFVVEPVVAASWGACKS